MTTIHTGARLHFGLFNVRGRGGVGLMIDEPSTEVMAQLAPTWSFEGELNLRTSFVVERLKNCYSDLPPMLLRIARAAPQHAGFGSGTQISLAMAKAILTEAGLDAPTEPIARTLDRGRRSMVGVCGFDTGGLILDPGSASTSRVELPIDWNILLVTPDQHLQWSGERELRAFDSLQETDGDPAIRELAVSRLIPAAKLGDLKAFGSALTEINFRAGQLFAKVQKGPYASAAIREIVESLKRERLFGIGQSSWGPTVFAFSDDRERLEHAAIHIASPGVTKRVTQARNRGAQVIR